LNFRQKNFTVVALFGPDSRIPSAQKRGTPLRATSRVRLCVGYESTRVRLRYPPSNARTLCGVVLAMASTLVPAFTRIWARVRLDVSTAKSVSRMADSADVRFSSVICN